MYVADYLSCSNEDCYENKVLEKYNAVIEKCLI